MKTKNNNFQNNIIWHEHSIKRVHREKKNNHKSIAVWFTGLSGSGKSSIADVLEKLLFKNGINTYLLDGDNVRSGLCSDLSFSILDREENMRRLGEVVKLMLDAGILVLISVISPYKYQREMICKMLGKDNFLEIFINTPISICKLRDPKKLYKKAHLGKISNFTGVQSKYEIPENPDAILNGTDSLEENVKKLIKILHNHKIVSFIS